MARPQPTYTPAEYLDLERSGESKSEYFEGQIFAMTGESRRHNLITANVVSELRTTLRKGPCEVYPGDIRVKVEATGLYTYPDVVVVCDEPRFEDLELDTLLNPTLVVEVLSKSTADYDRGRKFEHFRALPSLHEVLYVAQERVHLVHYQRRPDDTWLLTETRDAAGRLLLPSIHAELLISEVYAKVELEVGSGPTAV